MIVILCSGSNAHLALSAVKPRNGKITLFFNNMERHMSLKINDVTFIDFCQLMLPFLDKLSSNLSKDQFRETRKYLQPFYVQQPNQPQTNNVTVRVKTSLKPCATMKTNKATFPNHQHSRQINNNKLKKSMNI